MKLRYYDEEPRRGATTREKPTLAKLRSEKHLQREHLADAAGVSFQTEYLMEIGGFVTREDAECILNTFNSLAGTRYKLEDLNVRISGEQLI